MSDFRSDTVTQPTDAMKKAMLEAPLGDDVFGDDPTVNRLQELAADMLGFEAALLAPSGTQTNLIALMTHCQRGDEAIVGQQWHTYRWEAGGMAVLGSIQPQPLEHQPDGTIALADIEAAIKPDDPHFARTRLVALENTTGGRVLPLAYMRDVQALAARHGLRTHIDGARLFNAAVAMAEAEGGDPVQQAKEICRGYDSVSLCLSKGLGAPIGSLLLGSKDFIRQARRIRKMLGGGMRQAGMIAAAGVYALQHNVRRMADDHANARLLAEGLSRIAASHARLQGRSIAHAANTNIVFFDVDAIVADDVLRHLAENDVKITAGTQRLKDRAMKRIRWVTHLDVDRADVERALRVLAAF
ncbi:MAG TPA: low-specificity L-threonine aldolase [Noviherbaspirillum sp.]|uniref:low-specificity L-threonine aldolase n=1 Tax=Noviherbaspirillum sp. TaxID=1926288 RepID=UPI002B487EB5|nr:low-specificity L-threonine aldolase [Noviherbaspirillum sp.]HJV87679.1 low-specificity L-threonine aldolase [Noviherbaspirillum sp.]